MCVKPLGLRVVSHLCNMICLKRETALLWRSRCNIVGRITRGCVSRIRFLVPKEPKLIAVGEYRFIGTKPTGVMKQTSKTLEGSDTQPSLALSGSARGGKHCG